MSDVTARYYTDLASADPITREIARLQLNRLSQERRRFTGAKAGPSRWAHVPLADLFVEQGNRIARLADGLIECGHEPIHASRSDRCVLLDATRGRWWCRSCRKSGDAATYVMIVRGCLYREAAAWLSDRYGAPVGWRGPRRQRRRILVAVLP